MDGFCHYMFLCCLVECGVMEVSFVSSVLSFVIVLIIVARDTAFSFLFIHVDTWLPSIYSSSTF